MFFCFKICFNNSDYDAHIVCLQHHIVSLPVPQESIRTSAGRLLRAPLSSLRYEQAGLDVLDRPVLPSHG